MALNPDRGMPELKKKRTKGLFYTQSVKPYRYGLVVSIGQSLEELRASMEATDKEYGTDRAQEVIAQAEQAIGDGWPGFVFRMQSDSFFWLRDLPRCTSSYGVMVHELMHLVNGVMKSRGIRLSGTSTEEAYAYLIEELYIEMSNRVCRHLNPKRKRK